MTLDCLLSMPVAEADVSGDIGEHAGWLDGRLGVNEDSTARKDIFVQAEARRAQDAEEVWQVKDRVTRLGNSIRESHASEESITH